MNNKTVNLRIRLVADPNDCFESLPGTMQFEIHQRIRFAFGSLINDEVLDEAHHHDDNEIVVTVGRAIDPESDTEYGPEPYWVNRDGWDPWFVQGYYNHGGGSAFPVMRDDEYGLGWYT